MCIGSFQKSIKCHTSRGQAHDQEVAIQQSFYLERSSFNLSFNTNVNVALTSLYSAHRHTKHKPLPLPSGSETVPHETIYMLDHLMQTIMS